MAAVVFERYSCLQEVCDLTGKVLVFWKRGRLWDPEVVTHAGSFYWMKIICDKKPPLFYETAGVLPENIVGIISSNV